METTLHFNNVTLKKKMLLIISFAIIIVGISSTAAIRIIMAANNTLLHSSIAAALSYSSREISNILESIETSSSLIMSDQLVQNNLTSMKNSKMQNDGLSLNTAVRSIIYNSLQSYLYNNSYISNISIFQDDITISTTGDYPSRISDELKRSLSNAAASYKGRIYWFTADAYDAGVFLTRAIREIRNLSLDTLGILTIRLDMDKISTAATDFAEPFKSSHFVLLNQNEIFYSTLEHITKDELQDLGKDYTILDVGGEKYFTVMSKIDGVDWDYICLTPYSQTFHSISAAYAFSFTIILISIFFAIAFAEWQFRGITKHFALLVKKMNAFRGENMQILKSEYDYSKRKDELGQIHNHFDGMAAELKNLINDNYVKQLLIKDAQLKELETQINPHFLYNILESVNWRAKSIGEKQISVMVESLGRLLRATLSKDSEACITLETELGFIQSYITIQQIRFEERLNFVMEIDSALYLMLLPKLSVQPLIENAIHYSLEKNTEACNIFLTAEFIEETNTVRIYIKNDGSQFDDNLLNKLQTKEILPHGLGIGLVNINSRIQLTFGEEYGLSLYNEEELAVAVITLPFRTG